MDQDSSRRRDARRRTSSLSHHPDPRLGRGYHPGAAAEHSQDRVPIPRVTRATVLQLRELGESERLEAFERLQEWSAELSGLMRYDVVSRDYVDDEDRNWNDCPVGTIVEAPILEKLVQKLDPKSLHQAVGSSTRAAVKIHSNMHRVESRGPCVLSPSW